MKKLTAIFLFIMLSGFVFAGKVAVLPDLMKPGQVMAVDDSQLYVTEGASVLIYSLKDYKLVKKFGRKGEGPQEFPIIPQLPIPLIVSIHEDQLLVNSPGRITFFTKSGEFIKMLRVKTGFALGFQPIKDHYVALGFSQEKGINYNLVNLYDSELNKLKTIHQVKQSAQQSGPIKVFSDTVQVQAYNDNIFLSSGFEFKIDVLDVAGKLLYSIERDEKPVKFTKENEEEILENIKANPLTRQYYELFKLRAEFPSHFPKIAAVFIADDILHVLTFRREGQNFECLLFNEKGKMLNRFFLDFQFQASMQPYPFAFRNKNLYQLVENDDEEWELHVTPYR